MHRVVSASIATVLLAACTDSAGLAASDARGTYILERLDGGGLPAGVASGTVCPTLVTDASLSLTPRINNRRPLYSYIVFSRLACGAFGDRTTTGEFIRDVGEWDVGERGIGFKSDIGRGTYSAAAEAGAALALTFRVGDHTYTWRRVRDYDQPYDGFVLVSTVDEQGSFVNSTYFEARAANGEVSRGVTNNNRQFGVGGVAGPMEVRFAPTAPYVAAPGQANPVTVTVPTGGASVELRIVLTRPAG